MTDKTDGRKAPIRVVFQNGKAIGLVRARSEHAAIMFTIKDVYEAPIADQDALILHSKTFDVQDASAESGT